MSYNIKFFQSSPSSGSSKASPTSTFLKLVKGHRRNIDMILMKTKKCKKLSDLHVVGFRATQFPAFLDRYPIRCCSFTIWDPFHSFHNFCTMKDFTKHGVSAVEPMHLIKGNKELSSIFLFCSWSLLGHRKKIRLRMLHDVIFIVKPVSIDR